MPKICLNGTRPAQPLKRSQEWPATIPPCGALNRKSAYRASIGAIAMERLFFHCPTTGQDVDVGIESELQTLLRIRTSTVRARCPNCGRWHEWLVRDAQLAKAA
jgi:predicted RNA-binding Zn-ribbon protein involved in translation (DUF1610 family)